MLTITKLFDLVVNDSIFVNNHNIPEFVIITNSFFLKKKNLSYFNYYGFFTRLDLSINFSINNFLLSEFIYHNRIFYSINHNFFSYLTNNLHTKFFESLILPSKFNIILSFICYSDCFIIVNVCVVFFLTNI